MSHRQDASAFTMLERRAEARREKLSKSRNLLVDINKQKEKQQYESYMCNVNTLNQMKQIFTEMRPVLESKEAQEKEEANAGRIDVKKPQAAGKRS